MVEIYEDVLKEEPKDVESSQYEKWEKRLYKSVGYIFPMTQGKVLALHDKNGKLKPCGDVYNEEVVWDVRTEDGGFTCESQEHAELYSYLIQINERLKRIESKLPKEE